MGDAGIFRRVRLIAGHFTDALRPAGPGRAACLTNAQVKGEDWPASLRGSCGRAAPDTKGGDNSLNRQARASLTGIALWPE